tara:strand:- start:210 stop:554 length:345 start_codon:yes stop_codon:yes gene_type:complete
VNHKFFIADIVFLIAFIVQGMETHDSESSFIEISMPYAIAIVLIMSAFYKIGFIQLNNDHEHIKSLRVWMAIILLGTMIRFVLNDNFAVMYLLVVTGYSLFTSGFVRFVHKQLI